MIEALAVRGPDGAHVIRIVTRNPPELTVNRIDSKDLILQRPWKIISKIKGEGDLGPLWQRQRQRDAIVLSRYNRLRNC
jgi:hypothetical protein